MKEPNQGINRYCVVCNKPFWCSDGDYFCSCKCSDEWDRHNTEEIEDED